MNHVMAGFSCKQGLLQLFYRALCASVLYLRSLWCGSCLTAIVAEVSLMPPCVCVSLAGTMLNNFKL